MYAKDHSLLRFHYHQPTKLLDRLERLASARQKFQAAEDYQLAENPKFLPQDEIDAYLSRSQSDRLRIYSFYLQHSGPKERSAFLKDLYGIGGAVPAIRNSDWTDSDHDGKGLKLTTKAPNSPIHTVLLSWPKVAKRIDQMLQEHRFVTEDDRQHIPAFEKEHLVRSIISFADALPYENSSERDPMLQVTAFQFEASARTIRPILDDEGQLAHLLSVMEKEAAVIPQDHRNYEYCHQLLGELKQYRDGTFTLFPDPKEPLPAEQKHSSTRETTGQLSLEDFLSNAPEDSPIAEPAGSAPPEEKLQPLRLAAQAEYNDLKEHHPDHLLGFEQHGYYEFYGEDAKIVASLLGLKLLKKELVGGGTVEVTGFRAEEWASRAHTLWGHGHDVYLAGELPDHTHTLTKELLAKDSIGFVEVPQFFQPSMVVTMDTNGLAVDGHFGTWHSIDTKQIGGKDFYLMEHDEHGDEAASIIVDATGKLVAEDLWDGFTPEIVEMIAQEQGLQAAPENYLAAAEGYSEENYNQIDGRMDTQSKLTPGDDTKSQPEKQPNQKPSVLEKLKQKKDAVEEQKKLPPLPQRETGRDHTTLE